LVVLFGPNAAGKSNLLEAILLFSRLVGERTLSEAFAEGIRGYPLEAFTLVEGGLEQLLKGPNPGVIRSLSPAGSVKRGRDNTWTLRAMPAPE
jgi:hypothetical protein